MLNTTLIHPEILYALARNGHGSKVLITDGHFPAYTNTPAGSVKVFLNLAPGMCKVTDVLPVIISVIAVEKVFIMGAGDQHEVPIHEEFRSLIKENEIIEKLGKAEFYSHAASPQNCLTIVTGDMRRFANIILVTGVRKFDSI